MNTDPISDFLTRIRNAQHAHLESIVVPSSRMKFAIAKILEHEGYVGAAHEESDGPRKTLTVMLKYEGRQPVIRAISRVSTPGRRVYRKASDLPRVLSDQGIAVVSTSVGVMTNKEARKRRLGGEVLCEIY
jgi:small subunit ribosomal protein S8